MVTRARGPRGRALAAAALLTALPAAAGAHAVLVRSAPPARATLRVPPGRAQLWFSERLEPGYSTLSVWSGGAQVDAGPPAVAGDDARLLSVALPPLGGGVYTVRYRVLSVDGHVAEGAYSFTVGTGAGRQ